MIEVNCAFCGKSKKTYPSMVRNKKHGVFCDRHCLGKFRTAFLVKTEAANFKEGYTKNRKYVLVYAPWHPKAKDGRYIPLHRLLIETQLKRYLNSDEVVHHIDGDETNNHWENLELMSQSQHAKEHNNERDQETGQFIKITPT